MAPGPTARIAIFNDAYGALTVALRPFEPLLFSDSARSRSAVSGNLSLNGLDPLKVEALRDLPDSATQTVFSYGLVKIPKSLSLLEFQLSRLGRVLGPQTLVIGAGMSRHVHRSTLQIFEKYIGPVRTSRSWKKARLIFASPTGEPKGPAIKELTEYEVPGIPVPLVNLPGLFSRRRLDDGTRLLLEVVNVPPGDIRIADYGCGNGVIGICALLRNPDAKLVGIDDSALAVESARRNAVANGLSDRAAFVHGFSLEALGGPFDLILSNPPFHQARAKGIDETVDMFDKAAENLVTGGIFEIVANRHLGYHIHLERFFGNTRVVAESRRFVVLRAEKR